MLASIFDGVTILVPVFLCKRYMVDIGVTASAMHVYIRTLSTSSHPLHSDTIHVTVSQGAPSARRTKLTYVWYLVLPAIRTVSVGDHVRPSVLLCVSAGGGRGGGLGGARNVLGASGNVLALNNGNTLL